MEKKVYALGLLLISSIFLLNPQNASPVMAQDSPSQEILRLVNDLRSRNGLAPWVWDGRLAAAALSQVNYMAANNVYSHTGTSGSTPQTRARAAGFPGRATENIVGGTNLTPGQGVIWWQNSPIHLNTLLSPRYTHVGISSGHGFDQNFYVLVAGTPTDIVAPAAQQPPQANDQLLAPVAPIILAEPREDGSIVHVIDSGQSFWVIAARYEVPLEQLYLLNNLNEDSVISPGDELIIRLAEGQEPPPTPTPPVNHIVREGDSWWTIAAWHKLSVDDLLWLNSASEDSFLRPGDEVRIRLLEGESPPPTVTPQLSHVVVAGETAWDLSIRYGIPLDELLLLNDLGPSAVLSVGDELMIVTVTPTPLPTTTPTQTHVPTLAPTQTPQEAVTPSPQALAELETKPRLIITPQTEIIQQDEKSMFGQIGLGVGVALLAFGLWTFIIIWRRFD